MKNIFNIIFGSMLFSVLSVTSLLAQEPGAVVVTPHLYEKPFATIVYKIEGTTTGAETLYFDQWGMRRVSYRKAETLRYGVGRTFTYRLGSQIMIVDPDKNLGQKKVDENLKQILSSFKAEENKTLALDLLTLEGSVKLGTETFLNQTCDVWENQKDKLKTWVWQGIPLKMISHTQEGQVVTTAESVDFNTPLDEKVFSLPEGVQFIDRDINQILISLKKAQ